MPRSNPSPDDGSAAIEVLVLGVLLLVPLVYLVLTVAALQSAFIALRRCHLEVAHRFRQAFGGTIA